jgi:peptidoglycan/xylan/chitin deacetylase (PgdA/CDA1 family)
MNNLLIQQGLQKYVNLPKTVYLTFDDGPSQNTQKILDTLELYHVKATFFVIGKTDEFSKKMYKRIVDDGHTLALHTFSHTYSKIYASDEVFFADLEKLQTLLQEVTGIKTMYMRFPGGAGNTVSKSYNIGIMTRLTKEVKARGYSYFDWNISSGDANSSLQPTDTIVRNVLTTVKNKTHIMVLMHDAGEKTTTAEALPRIIEGLKNDGYIFSAVNDLTPSFSQTVLN